MAARRHRLRWRGWWPPGWCAPPRGRGRYGRIIASCAMADGGDLGAHLVAAGLAWDYARYSGGRYADEQAHARRNALGIWARACAVPPWAWRRGDRSCD